MTSSSEYFPVPGPPSSSRKLSDESDRSSISSILENINEYAEKNPRYSSSHDESGFYVPSNDTADSSTAFLDGAPPRYNKPQHRWKVVLWVSSLIAVLFVGTIVLLSSVGSSSNVANSTLNATTSNLADAVIHTDKRLFDMNAWRDGILQPSYKPIHWIAPAPGDDKVKLIEETSKGFVLVNWPDRDNKSTIIKEEERFISYEGENYFVSAVSLSPNHKYALLTANWKKNYRHSSFASFFILTIETKTIVPLYPGNAGASVALARWSPTSDRISFVLENNLYIREVGKGNGDKPECVKQATVDGGTEIFYGVPDWVYEEEVFQGDTALWWSPKGDYLAFLRTNDSAVEEFPIPYFVQNSSPYPELRRIKYPKPGFPNPIVDLQVLELDAFEVFEAKVEANKDSDPEKLITEVVWTGDHHLIQRISNRESDLLKVGVFNAESRKGEISRTVDVDQDGGWFEISQNLQFVPASPDEGRPDNGYIDMVVVDGYNHLAYFSPVWSKEPKAILTSGKWEVEDEDVIFNQKTNRVYFTSTKKSSVERHLYSVNLNGSDLQAITNETEDGWYSSSFSADNRYVLLSYQGPGIPWQKVLDLEADETWASAVTLTSNDHLISRLESFALPTQTFSQIPIATGDDGEEILANAVEHRPPFFNASLQYPVLFYVYGGPVSQLVNKKFAYSFSQVVASELNAIVVTVDGRGTGFMGRDFRKVVRKQLGVLESQDQITAAKLWASKSYVDSERMAIWGWSYGGFMTLKTLETDAGQTFAYGMSVAPVTSWRFYDSIYTERYMKTPQHNADGYENSSIHNVTAIGQAERFLLMHGSGDDNVHFQNSLVLLDKFDLHKVENYDMHVFPDSDHSISFHNANRIVYDKLLHWLSDAFAGRFKKLQ